MDCDTHQLARRVCRDIAGVRMSWPAVRPYSKRKFDSLLTMMRHDHGVLAKITTPCRRGRHEPGSRVVENAGMSFSQCHRCGTDLVFADRGWTTPAPGHRVVWRPRTAGTVESGPGRPAVAVPAELPLRAQRLNVAVTVTYRLFGEAQDVRRRFASRFGRPSGEGEIIIASPIYSDQPAPMRIAAAKSGSRKSKQRARRTGRRLGSDYASRARGPVV